MLETLYVMTPGVSIGQNGGLLVLEKDHAIIKEIPMATVGSLVLGEEPYRFLHKLCFL